MHSDETSKSGNKSGYDHWSKKSNQEIIDSLKPGKKDSLKVKEDGTVVDGNARILILQQRGVDVNSLPREIHKPQPMEGAP